MVKKKDTFVLARKRQQEIQGFFDSHGLGHITVPLPNISEKEFKARQKKHQAPFFRPATKDISYGDFMRALEQGDHRTVANEEERAKIGWEPTEQGYWFWAEVQAECPRLGTSWNDLTNQFNLLCLEEYVIVWHTHKILTNAMIDEKTCTWLRTKYRFFNSFGALNARGWYGLVGVYECWHLALSSDDEGGRLAEVIKL